MDDKIKAILKQNHLLDSKCNSIENFDVEFNKLDDFLNTYKQNHTNKQSIPDVSRDNKGRIILEEIPFIVSNIEDIHINWLLLNNGTKLLLKENRSKDENDFEILMSYFLKQLDIKHARYDVATYKDKEYLVSPSFLRNGEKINVAFDKCPNIKDGYNKMTKYGGESFFLKTCFVDRIYGNIDRFPCNFGIITGAKINGKNAQERLCPLFDNVDKNSVLIREEKYNFFPYIDDEITNCKDMFSYLLEYEEIMNFAGKQVRKSNIYKAVCEMKKDKKIIMDNNYYNKVQSFFKDSQYLINDALKDKGKSFSIKLT